MEFKTTDLADEFEDDSSLQMAEPIFRDFGGTIAFCGPVATVKVFEDNVLVRSTLETSGEGRVLVVDGEGSTRCALMGDLVAQIACDNGWAGVVINGCVRDSADIAKIAVGAKALATVPRRSKKGGKGTVGVPLAFAGVTFVQGDYVYADEDGILIAKRNLLAT